MRAFHILAPITRRIEAEDPTTHEAADRVIVTGFRPIPVFRLEDTDGDPLPDPPDYTPAALPPLYEVADALGLTVTYQPFAGSYYGAYFPGAHEVRLMTHDVKTWFHELAHAADHSVHGDAVQGGQEPKTETVAEVVAVTLARLYGFQGWEWHGAEYVRGYAKGDPARAAMQLIARIQRVLDRILELAASNGAAQPLQVAA